MENLKGHIELEYGTKLKSIKSIVNESRGRLAICKLWMRNGKGVISSLYCKSRTNLGPQYFFYIKLRYNNK